MSQNRDAPAFQEYAANILARLPFRTMTLQDRGLFYTMRLECWVNVRLPNDHNKLAKVLGVPVSVVASSLAAVMPFFNIIDGFISSPELENYRAHLAERKQKQSQGGKLGSEITNKKRKGPTKGGDDGGIKNPSSTSQPPHQGGSGPLVQQNTEKPNQNQPAEDEVIKDPFVTEYEAAESCTAKTYVKASRGG